MPRLENKRSTVLLAAVGDLGKYLCEELLSDDRFDVEILSRKVGEYFIPQNIKHRPRPCFGEHPAYAVVTNPKSEQNNNPFTLLGARMVQT